MKAILEIELPKNCSECRLQFDGYCNAKLALGLSSWISRIDDKRDKNCPLRVLDPHECY